MLLPKLFDSLYERPVGSSMVIVISPLTGCGIRAVAVTSEDDSKR